MTAMTITITPKKITTKIEIMRMTVKITMKTLTIIMTIQQKNKK